MSAIITDDFRRNNADAFVTAINTLAVDSPLSQSTGFYVGIGKSDPWLDDTAPPTPTGSELERQDVLQNLNSMKLIESNEVERLLPKTGQAWVTGRKYKAYDITDRTCFNQTIVGSSINQYACYVHLNGVLYLCLSNNSNGASSVSPSSAAAADGDVGQNSGDSYIWTRIGVIPTSSDFVDSTTFFEIPANLSSGIDTIGLLYGFKVVNGGAGYSTVDGAKAAKLRYTQLDGTTATAILTLNGDGVGVVTVTSPGTGYTNTQPPLVLIGEPTIIREEIGVDGYSGDFGEVVAIGASGSQQIYFDLFIPVNSFMRDAEYVGSSVTVSTLAANDYVTIYNTNLSIGNFESKDVGGSTLGVSTTNLDNVYQVISSVSRYGNVPGVGSTVVQRITVGINTNSGLSDTSAADMGEFSWGKIQFEGRETPASFNFYGTNGVVGISTGGVLSRFNPLKFTDYTA